MGRLTSVTEASGSSGYTYDAQGRVSAEAKVIGGGGYTTPLVTGYGYDANGAVTGITYPSGDALTVSRTTDGLVSGITLTPAHGSTQTLASNVAYAPFGPLSGLTYGNGLALGRVFDEDYRLIRTRVAPPSGTAVLDLGFHWQTDGRLAWSVDDTGGARGATYGYTPSGRVNAADNGPWGSCGYAYDAAGNQTSSGPGATPVLASIDTATNRVTGTTLSGSVQRTLSYQAGGELSQDAHAGGTTYKYTYDTAERPTRVWTPGQTLGSYAYDYLGRRVWRHTYGTGAFQSAYVYDADGRLLAEHNAASGRVNKEYVWIDDMPVARIDSAGGSAAVDFIHTGQIGEPLLVTASDQSTAWSATLDPFGNATVAPSPVTTLDLRLPGQWYTLENNGLHRNGVRDYDPSLGRYIEPDPLGIDAGQNLYVYVDGDPIILSDQFGLCPAGTHPASAAEAQNIISRARAYIPRHLSHSQLQCNQLVDRSINSAYPGTVAGEPNTLAMRNGSVPSLESVSTPSVGNVALFAYPGHVVFATAVEGGQITQFLGSQSSTGPALVDLPNSYWSAQLNRAGNVSYYQICIPD